MSREIMSYRFMRLAIITAPLYAFFLAGCGESSVWEKNQSDYAKFIDSKNIAKSHVYIYEINSKINDKIATKLKEMSVNISSDIAKREPSNFVNIAIYFFEENKIKPDISMYYYDHGVLTDFLYDGDHEGWSFMYIDPITGPAKWVSCLKELDTFCKE